MKNFPGLTLLTCKDYDPRTDTYRNRIAVRAVLVSVIMKSDRYQEFRSKKAACEAASFDQQILGSISPGSMSTSLVPPMAVFKRTFGSP